MRRSPWYRGSRHRLSTQSPGLPETANGLRVNPTPVVIGELATRYSIEAVRSFSGALADLPPERLVHTDQTLMDRVAQIHRNHVGDTRSGKWRDLSEPVQAEVTQFFALPQSFRPLTPRDSRGCVK
jgi:hypothetical protein